MCIFGLKSRDKEIATEDIIVLKVVKVQNGRLCSPVFSDELWGIGIEKSVEFCIHEDKFELETGKYYTTTGIYSFDINCDPNICLMSLRFWGTLKIYEAIIPQGAEYIRKGNQYCSNKLKLISEIK